MLDAWIDLARGPLLKIALLLMALGLARVLLLQVVELVFALRRAGDQVVAWRLVLRRNLAWLQPWRAFRQRDRIAYSVASMVFHVAVILVPVFFAGHVDLWRRGLGLALPTLPNGVADALSLAALASLVGLLAGRWLARERRHLGRPQDTLLLGLFILCFLTGLMASHPAWSPIGARSAYLAHLLTGEFVLVLVPFSKLQHIVLFWTSQASSELGWRFTPGSGERVRLSLGKQAQGV